MNPTLEITPQLALALVELIDCAYSEGLLPDHAADILKWLQQQYPQMLVDHDYMIEGILSHNGSYFK